MKRTLSKKIVQWLKKTVTIFVLLAAASPALADVYAQIDNDPPVSFNENDPTEVVYGSILTIKGGCSKDFYTTRTSAAYYIFDPSQNQGVLLKDRSSPNAPLDDTNWLTNSTVDIEVGKIWPTTRIGDRFKVSLRCEPGVDPRSNTKSVYFKVIAAKSPPKVAWLNTNPVYSNGDTKIQVRVTGTNDGVGQVFILWTGASLKNLEMQHVGGDLYEYTIATAALTEGLKQVDIRATSQSGADNGWEQAGSFIVDRTPPTINWDSHNPAVPTDDRIRIMAGISDLSGLSDVRIWWEGAPSENSRMVISSPGQFGYTIDTSLLPLGEKRVLIRAKDNAGNDTDWEEKGKFTVTGQPPTIAWDDTNPAWTRGAVRINVNITDPDSSNVKAWIQWTGAASISTEMKKGAGNQYYYDIPVLTDGIKNVQVYVDDGDGNVINWTSVGQFTVDKTPPVIESVTTEIDKANGNIKVSAIIPDPFTGVESAWASFSNPPSAEEIKLTSKGGNLFESGIDVSHLNDGIHLLQIRAIDFHGNDTGWTKQGRITLDRTPPVIAWHAPQDNASFSDNSVHIAGTVSDIAPNAVIIEWREEKTDPWRSATVQIAHGSATFAYELSGLNDNRRYQLRLRADDTAGNVSENTPIRTIHAKKEKQEEQLLLKKTVDKKAAAPGDRLHYTIAFTNLGNEDLHDFVITDDVQSAYLTVRNAQCGPSMPSTLTCCVRSAQTGHCNATVEQAPGMLEWHLEGVLPMGESGSVSYELLIRQQ